MNFINDILKNAYAKGFKTLNEADCYQILNRIGIKTPRIKTIAANEDILKTIKDFPGEKIVIKILSEKTLHKTDKGGVKICIKENAKQTFKDMAAAFPETNSFMLTEFIDCPPFTLGREILLGARLDEAFGPVITLGFGGTDSEYFAKNLKEEVRTALTAALNADFDSFIESSLLWRYAGGKARGSKAQISKAALSETLQKLAGLMLYFSPLNKKAEFFIEEFEINPLCAGGGVLTALDGVLRFKKAEFAKSNKTVTESGLQSLLTLKARR